jgi:hypothetical protein
VPTSVSAIDLLVVMGGPQSSSTTTAECPHFDAVAEEALIAKAISAGINWPLITRLSSANRSGDKPG